MLFKRRKTKEGLFFADYIPSKENKKIKTEYREPPEKYQYATHEMYAKLPRVPCRHKEFFFQTVPSSPSLHVSLFQR